MSDTYGGISIPVATSPAPIGDPILAKVGAFAKAVINQGAGAAWAALRPRSGSEALPVRFVFTHDPHLHVFNDNQLPALFVYRGADDEDLSWHADDWQRSESKLRLLWVFPPDSQDKHTPRRAFGNAVAKVLAAAIELGRDPAWVDDADTDVTASSYDADADSIKTAVQTSTAAQVYSGAALTGVVGAALMNPRRALTVTTTAVDPSLVLDPGDGGAGDDDGAGEVYNTADPIVVTFVDWYGQTRTKNLFLTLPFGGETIGIDEDVKQVVSLSVPAQQSELGAFSFGTAAVEGRGSVLLERAGLLKLELTKWQLATVDIDVDEHSTDGLVRRLKYDAVMMQALIQERLVRDSSAHYYPHNKTDIDYYKELLSVGRAELPDSNG